MITVTFGHSTTFRKCTTCRGHTTRHYIGFFETGGTQHIAYACVYCHTTTLTDTVAAQEDEHERDRNAG